MVQKQQVKHKENDLCFFSLKTKNNVGELLSVLGRLLTVYMSNIAFTCGLDDMILNSTGETQRQKLFAKADIVGFEVAKSFTERNTHTEIMQVLGVQMRRESERAVMDSLMKQKLNPIASEVVSTCLPHNQMKRFPSNNMSLMTVSGAKGTNVNYSQITCLLGQQELEGKRAPIMQR